MRLRRIYTRRGDDGTTDLGAGDRVGKDDPQLAACGDVDELNSALGAALALGVANDLAPSLTRIQSELFHVGGELCLVGAAPDKRPPTPLIQTRHVEALERECDRFNESLGASPNFVVPGGAPAAAALHLARTICRRAERSAVALSRSRSIPPDVLRYLNRLSDLLFIMARFENRARGVPDALWDGRE